MSTSTRTNADQPCTDADRRPAGDGLVDVGEVRLYVRRLGSGSRPPLLVIHGGPSWDHSYLLPAVGLLADLRQVFLVDLRGCGRSSRGLPLEAYRHELAAADLSRLVERLGFDAVDVLGFSYGGALALRMLERRPDQVRRIVLASTSAYEPGTPGTTLPAELDAERLRRLGPDATLPPFGDPRLDAETRTREDAQRAAVLHVWNLALVPLWRRVLARVRFSGDWLAPYEAGLLGPARPHDPEGLLRAAGVPTLILHGARDLGFPVGVAERLHAAVPGSELAVVADAAHMAHVDRPYAWLDPLRGFLAPHVHSRGTSGRAEP